MAYPYTRARRLRKNEAIRKIVAETSVNMDDFIVPMFVMEGSDGRNPIKSMPGYCRFTRDLAVREAKSLYRQGVRSILLFVKTKIHEVSLIPLCES